MKCLRKHSNASSISIIIMIIFSVAIAVLFLAPVGKQTKGYETFSEILADMNTKDELTALADDYKDHRMLSWKSYHIRTQPGYFKKKINNVFALFGQRPNWSPSYFVNLLDKRIKEREERGFKYPYVVRLVPSEKARFVVWGDLNGAYNSFVRDLQKLIQLDILGEDLKLKHADDYLVLMGDVAGRTPFIMELLTVIMKLEEKNPNRVFYLTGNNEQKGAWYTYGLKEELEMKASDFTSEQAPLFKVAERYFNTLPLGIYVSAYPHDSNKFVRFSHFDLDVPSDESYTEWVDLLHDEYYSKDLLADRKPGDVSIIRLDRKHETPDEEKVEVPVTIKSVRKMTEFQKNDGLRMLSPDRGATAWNLSSNPTVVVQKLINFWNDAFVVVQAAPQLEDWTITLYYRDIRTNDDFKTLQYNFITGKAPEGQADSPVVSTNEKDVEKKENKTEVDVVAEQERSSGEEDATEKATEAPVEESATTDVPTEVSDTNVSSDETVGEASEQENAEQDETLEKEK